ncbi:hypothetical protein DL96DRAFT_1717850 [Flagelloscypha sp. PMI_526]|nr:hypothetical protein DL96DRAFT_1717850 [Flagelloscypha sp. PMI_526]
MMSGALAVVPVEILEDVVRFHCDDFFTLAACSLSSSVFLPVCRSIQFHTITLETFSHVAFEVILRTSPAIAQYVRRVYIHNPDQFTLLYRGCRPALQFKRHQLESVSLDIRTTQHPSRSLQNITVDVLCTPAKLLAWPCSQKIRKLCIFNPCKSPEEYEDPKQLVAPLPISTLRLSNLDWDLNYDTYRFIWDFHLTIVLELRDRLSEKVVLPSDRLPNLRKLWIVFPDVSPYEAGTQRFLKKWSTWLNTTFSTYRQQHPDSGVTIFVRGRTVLTNELAVGNLGPQFHPGIWRVTYLPFSSFLNLMDIHSVPFVA